MTDRFGVVLARLRSDAGFPTAYAFYHRNGGRRAFPFSYAYYTQIERGSSVPRASWLPIILSLLRFPPETEARRALLESYLRDLVGHNESFRDLFAPLLKSETAAARPSAAAVTRLMGLQAHHVTPAQFKAVLSSAEAYWANTCLSHSQSPLSTEEIARTVGSSSERVRTALAALKAARMVKGAGKDRWRSPFVDRYVVLPRNYPGYVADVVRLKSYYAEMIGKKGGPVDDLGLVFRADPETAFAAAKAFRETIEAASTSFRRDKGDRTALYLLESRIRKLLPY